VLRDVGRVLEIALRACRQLCKLVPQNPAAAGDAYRAPSQRAAAAGPSATITYRGSLRVIIV